METATIEKAVKKSQKTSTKGKKTQKKPLKGQKVSKVAKSQKVVKKVVSVEPVEPKVPFSNDNDLNVENVQIDREVVSPVETDLPVGNLFTVESVETFVNDLNIEKVEPVAEVVSPVETVLTVPEVVSEVVASVEPVLDMVHKEIEPVPAIIEFPVYQTVAEGLNIENNEPVDHSVHIDENNIPQFNNCLNVDGHFVLRDDHFIGSNGGFADNCGTINGDLIIDGVKKFKLLDQNFPKEIMGDLIIQRCGIPNFSKRELKKLGVKVHGEIRCNSIESVRIDYLSYNVMLYELSLLGLKEFNSIESIDLYKVHCRNKRKAEKVVIYNGEGNVLEIV